MAGKQKTWLGTTNRYARLRRIQTLDPAADANEIAGLFYADFASLMMSLTFTGFLMTFAAPRMSRILDATGEIGERAAKRAVDTILFSVMWAEHGSSPGPGRDAARRVNGMHRAYDIHPDDFIAVACDTLTASLDLADKYGWRPVTDRERLALCRRYDQQARVYGSPQSVPATEAEIRVFLDRYFNEQFSFEPQNLRLATSILDYFGSLAPRHQRWLARAILFSVTDPRVLVACGLPQATRAQRLVGHLAMTMQGRRGPLPDTAPDQLEDLIRSVYPTGWTIDMLGTHPEPRRRAPSRRAGPGTEEGSTAGADLPGAG
jgi:hypothetical protein